MTGAPKQCVGCKWDYPSNEALPGHETIATAYMSTRMVSIFSNALNVCADTPSSKRIVSRVAPVVPNVPATCTSPLCTVAWQNVGSRASDGTTTRWTPDADAAGMDPAPAPGPAPASVAVPALIFLAMTVRTHDVTKQALHKPQPWHKHTARSAPKLQILGSTSLFSG